MKRYRPETVCCLIAITLLAGADSPGNVVKKVREGLEHFRSREYSKAETSFLEAEKLDPENAAITFDRACAAMAGGDVEQARSLFRTASLSKDAPVTVKSHYNLGCLEADQARATLGEDPVAATGETREESVKLLLASVRHYRDVLKLNPTHKDARHNMELIRLFLKHIQSQWAEQDRQKDRQEKDLLQFLLMLEEKESSLRSATQALLQQDDSPQRRQAVREAAESQRTLQEEIQPLKDKITESLSAASQAPPAAGGQPPSIDEQTQQALQVMHGIADEAGSRMQSAAGALANADFDTAITAETETLNLLNQLYMAAAPYPNILQRALQQQEQLAPDDDSAANDSKAQQNTTEADADTPEESAAENGDKPETPAAADDDRNPHSSLDEVSREQLIEDQSRITEWSRILPLKAESALPQLQQQLESMQAVAPGSESEKQPSDNDDEPPTDSDQEKSDSSDDKDSENEQVANDDASTNDAQKQQLEQLKGMVESMQLAIQLSPEAEKHSQAAADHLTADSISEAEPEQVETLRLLKEIAEPLKQQNQDQQNQNPDDDQNQQDDSGSGQDQQGKKDQQEEADDQQQNSEQQKQEPQKQQSRQQAESVLRQARERERKHRELQKQLRAILGQRFKVDKDW